MNRIIERVKQRWTEDRENGFSLLELVIAIGILLVLTVGGLIGYGAVQNNAKKAATQAAASEVATAALAFDTDGTNPAEDASAQWNETRSKPQIETDSGAFTTTIEGKEVRCVFGRADHVDGYSSYRVVGDDGCESLSEDGTDGDGSETPGGDDNTPIGGASDAVYTLDVNFTGELADGSHDVEYFIDGNGCHNWDGVQLSNVSKSFMVECVTDDWKAIDPEDILFDVTVDEEYNDVVDFNNIVPTDESNGKVTYDLGSIDFGEDGFEKDDSNPDENNNGGSNGGSEALGQIVQMKELDNQLANIVSARSSAPNNSGENYTPLDSSSLSGLKFNMGGSSIGIGGDGSNGLIDFGRAGSLNSYAHAPSTGSAKASAGAVDRDGKLNSGGSGNIDVDLTTVLQRAMISGISGQVVDELKLELGSVGSTATANGKSTSSNYVVSGGKLVISSPAVRDIDSSFSGELKDSSRIASIDLNTGEIVIDLAKVVKNSDADDLSGLDPNTEVFTAGNEEKISTAIHEAFGTLSGKMPGENVDAAVDSVVSSLDPLVQNLGVVVDLTINEQPMRSNVEADNGPGFTVNAVSMELMPMAGDTDVNLASSSVRAVG